MNENDFTLNEKLYLGQLSSFQAVQVQPVQQPVRTYADLREVFDLMDCGFTLGEARIIAYDNHASRRFKLT